MSATSSRSSLIVAALLSAAVLAPSVARGAHYEFNIGSGAWESSDSWNPASNPVITDTAAINNQGEANVSGTHSIHTLTIGRDTIENRLIIGNTGNLSITGSAVGLANLIVGDTASGSGSITVNGVLNNTGTTTFIGYRGSGTLTVNEGAKANFAAFTAAHTSSGSNATIVVNGEVTSGATSIGNRGSASLVLNGTWTTGTGGTFTVGGNGGSVGTLEVGSDAVLTVNSTVRFGSNGADGLLAASRGYGVIRGQLSSTGQFLVGDKGHGLLTLGTNGVVTVGATGTGTLTMGNEASATGVVNFGGVVDGSTIGAAEAAGRVTANAINGGAGSATVNFNHTGTNYHLTKTGDAAGAAVAINGSAKVNAYAGVTTLSASSTYSGGTTIQGNGTRLIARHNAALGTGAVAASQNGAVQIANGATVANAITLSTGQLILDTGTASGAITFAATGNAIRGHGTVTQALTLTSGNTIRAGSNTAAGSLAFTNGLTLGSGSEVVIDFFNDSSFDLLSGTNITFGGLLTVHFASLPTDADPIQLFNFTSYSGNFSDFSYTGLSDDYIVHFNATNGTLSVAAIPEPGTWALLLSSLAAGAAFRRFRRTL